jgi:hypothetical protein
MLLGNDGGYRYLMAQFVPYPVDLQTVHLGGDSFYIRQPLQDGSLATPGSVEIPQTTYDAHDGYCVHEVVAGVRVNLDHLV